MSDDQQDTNDQNRIGWVAQQEDKDEGVLMISNRNTAADSLESNRQNSDQNLVMQ